MSRATVIYARISKADVGDTLGVERQVAECEKLAAGRGFEVVETYVDNDRSAFDRTRRPRYDAMVDRLRVGDISTLIAWHPDRITRRLDELQPLIDFLNETGVSVETVVAGLYDLATPSGRMSARLVGTVAEYESEHKSERLRAKMDQLASAGKPPGGRTPYGFLDGYAGHDPDEARTVRFIADRVLDGRSMLSIARELNETGVPTKEGRAWHNSTVRTVVTNPAVAGLRVHRRQVVGDGQWEPILDRETWESVRAVLQHPDRKRRRAPRDYLLTGLVHTFEGHRMRGRLDGERRTYINAAPDPDQVYVSVDARSLEELTIEAVMIRLDGVDLAQIGSPPSASPSGLVSEVQRLEAKLAVLAESWAADQLSQAEWLAARKGVERRLTEARARLGADQHRDRLPLAVTSARGSLRDVWPGLRLEDQRAVLAAVVDRVVISSASVAGNRFDPARVEIRWAV